MKPTRTHVSKYRYQACGDSDVQTFVDGSGLQVDSPQLPAVDASLVMYKRMSVRRLLQAIRCRMKHFMDALNIIKRPILLVIINRDRIR